MYIYIYIYVYIYIYIYLSIYIYIYISRIFPKDDPMALSAMSKLAVVLASAAARGCAAPPAAADALRAAAARLRRVLGPASPEARAAEDELTKLGLR